MELVCLSLQFLFSSSHVIRTTYVVCPNPLHSGQTSWQGKEIVRLGNALLLQKGRGKRRSEFETGRKELNTPWTHGRKQCMQGSAPLTRGGVWTWQFTMVIVWFVQSSGAMHPETCPLSSSAELRPSESDISSVCQSTLSTDWWLYSANLLSNC